MYVERVLGRCCSSCSYCLWRNPFLTLHQCKRWRSAVLVLKRRGSSSLTHRVSQSVQHEATSLCHTVFLCWAAVEGRWSGENSQDLQSFTKIMNQPSGVSRWSTNGKLLVVLEETHENVRRICSGPWMSELHFICAVHYRVDPALSDL